MMYLYMNIVKNVIIIHMYKFTGGETGHVHIYKYVYVKKHIYIYIYTYTYLYLMNV